MQKFKIRSTFLNSIYYKLPKSPGCNVVSKVGQMAEHETVGSKRILLDPLPWAIHTLANSKTGCALKNIDYLLLRNNSYIIYQFIGRSLRAVHKEVFVQGNFRVKWDERGSMKELPEETPSADSIDFPIWKNR